MKEMGTESTLIVSLFLPSTLSSSNSPGVSNGSKTAESPVRQFPDLPSLSYYHHRPLSSGGGTLKRARTLTTSTAIEAKELVPSLSGNIGLHNAIASVPASAGLPRNKWIGSLDVPTESWTEATREAITKKLAAKGQIPVFLSDSEMEGHYNQFCKQVLWKTFHYQFPVDTSASSYEQTSWKQYVAVNLKFAQKIAQVYESGDTIWINDYHLMLVPEMVRKLLPNASIGFFLHIPFPSSEIFRCLFVRNQILLGILGADLVGFQTYSFMRHFLMTCSRLLSLESTPKGIQLENTIVSVGIFPIGINVISLNEKRKTAEVAEMMQSLKEKYAGKKVVIGRDKNDYVKGVRLKLLAFERFLYLHPEWVGKVVLIQVALSTTEANENECMVSDVVARINSKFGSIEYLPVVYLHQDISFPHYLAMLSIADACLITSLRDGMNLTSHEYVVCQSNKCAPLIMSEFAGTYGSFGCALRVNPWDKQEVADAINEALTMSEEERGTRWKELYRHVTLNTAQNFVESFIKETRRVHLELSQNQPSRIPCLSVQGLILDFSVSQRRLLLIDDLGTLMKASSVTGTPNDDAKNDDPVYNLLAKLSSDPRNLVYLMSGRRRNQLEYYRDISHIGICAENGSFIRFADRNSWVPMLPDIDVSWKKPVAEIFEYYTDRTPGSYIEQKETSIVWHLGRADQSFGSWQAAECTNHIQNSLSATYSIHSLAKKRSVEVMPRNVNKGIATRRIIEHHQGRRNTYSTSSAQPQTPVRHRSETTEISEDMYSPENSYVSPQARSLSPPFPSRRGHIDFILTIGDDRQDEYMFDYLNRNLDRQRSQSVGSEPSPVLSEPPSPGVFIESDMESLSLEQHRWVNGRHTSIWTCTVGVKSSAAKWYLPGPPDVLDMLEKLLSVPEGNTE